MQIIFALKGQNRNAIPRLEGRSGRLYSHAHFRNSILNEKDEPVSLLCHVTAPIEYNEAVRKDLQDRPGQLCWFPILCDENPEIARLTHELAEARAHIAMLEASMQPSALPVIVPEPGVFDGLQSPSVDANAPLSFAEMNVRPLRELCRERGIAIPHNSTKPQLVALLEAVATPAA